MRSVILVSCCGQKLQRPAPARELYCSPLFRLARAYAERHGHPWLILSALHGAIAPDQVIAPYDLRLPRSKADRAALWGAPVARQLLELAPGARQFVSLAGAPYTDTVEPHLVAAGCAIAYPLAGLGIGRRLAWLKAGLPIAITQPAGTAGTARS